MATYLIKSEKTITRQEGDSADLGIIVPEALPLTAPVSAKFVVKDVTGRTLITKTSPDAITISGQNITLAFQPSETKSKSGTHRWELEITTAGNTYTIGRGNFIIMKELI